MYEDKRVDTKRETDQKCPSCGGTMDFNPKTGGLTYSYTIRSSRFRIDYKRKVSECHNMDGILFFCLFKKHRLHRCSLVGVTRFELATSWSRTKRATKLRYTPCLDIITRLLCSVICYFLIFFMSSYRLYPHHRLCFLF
jgi:hypothetical protein